jgi:hypothetical protein
LLSAQAPKRAVELYWLRYTLVWGLVAAVIMLGGVAETWGDAELIFLGIVFALGAVVPPIVRAVDRDKPVVERTAAKMVVSVVGLSLLMNYFCTPYFFDVLHMHFGFNTSINIRNNPVFLYLMTVAYFATYSVLVCMSYRVAMRGPASIRWLLIALAPFLVAFLETVLNANPFMKSLFCFDDMAFMLWFGTLSYGACFLFAMPLWIRIDDTLPMRFVVLGVLVVMTAIVISFALLRQFVAPHFTTVVDGANGLRDFASSCLVRP